MPLSLIILGTNYYEDIYVKLYLFPCLDPFLKLD